MTSKEFVLKGLKKGLKKFEGVNIENLFKLEDLNIMFHSEEYDFFEKYILEENWVEPIQFNRTSYHFFRSRSSSYNMCDLESLMYGTHEEKLEFIFNDFIYNHFYQEFCISLKDGKLTFQDEGIDNEYIDSSYMLEGMFKHFEKDIDRYIEDNIISVNNVLEYIHNFKEEQ